MTIFLGLTFFWFLRTLRMILFYVYLWQLKEYHIGRFINHFKTEDGKRLAFNPLKIAKFVLIPLFFLAPAYFPFIIGFFYIGESLVLLKGLLRKTLLLPLPTKKTIFISFFAIILFALIPASLYLVFRNNLPRFTLELLYADIVTPIIISMAVLLFQPLAVIARNRIIEKAKTKRNSLKDLFVIGITGSFGKTSTKEFLYAILSQKFNVLKTKGNQNSEVGVSQCILNDLREEHEIFICEMGAYGKGGIKLISGIVKPQMAILLGANEQHLALFGSMKNLARAEGGEELVEALPERGLAIFNGDNKYSEILYLKTKRPKRLCVTNKAKAISPDIWAENIKIEKESISFKAVAKNDQTANFKVNLLGGHNVQNLLLAIMAAKELGLTLEEISDACKKITREQGAMKLFTNEKGLNIIDSTYSANPDGVISALEYLKIWPGKKVLVMPCLIELGKASKEVHRRIGQKIAEVCNLAIITTGDRFKEIKATGGDKVVILEKPRDILKKINSTTSSGDVVLLESRVPKELINLLNV